MEIPVQIRPSSQRTYEEAIEEGFWSLVDDENHAKRNTSSRLTSESSIPAMEILFRKIVLKMKRALGSDRSDEYLFNRVANISNFLKGIYYEGV